MNERMTSLSGYAVAGLAPLLLLMIHVRAALRGFKAAGGRRSHILPAVAPRTCSGVRIQCQLQAGDDGREWIEPADGHRRRIWRAAFGCMGERCMIYISDGLSTSFSCFCCAQESARCEFDKFLMGQRMRGIANVTAETTKGQQNL